MISLRFALVLLAGTFLGCVLSHPERPALLDPAKARELFALAQGNGTAKDGVLSTAEVEAIFANFDMDGDSQVRRQEFVNVWTHKGLGDIVSANFLFARADTDSDGTISASPDLSRVFKYFDLNGDGTVSEMEFVVVWSSLSH
ncbi:uncharacterized protein [Littorina saxatilis]|uniref:EF-hand domain-containing protein n=1 Tax=Littorina saxatilis TaxID=31220 RepID=A0AAN9AWW7_9CAEN